MIDVHCEHLYETDQNILEVDEMKALDELRRCFDNCAILNTENAKKVVNEKADAIEKELEERYVKLPLDADGVPIHIGDEMVGVGYGKHKYRFIVSELDFMGAYVRVVGIVDDIKYFFKPSKIVHSHKPAVEDVLREFAIACEDAGNAGDAINRLISEYAERLQLKE